jgi:hypothetical protein
VQKTSQSIPAQLREGKYAAEVPLPALAPGQVCWVQPVLVNGAGVSQWGEATSYQHDARLVLQRKPAMLQFKSPNNPIERTVRMTSKEAATLYTTGKPYRRSEQLDSFALESLRPDDKPGGGPDAKRTSILLTLARPWFVREIAGRRVVAPPQFGAQTARFSPRLELGRLGEIRGIIVPSNFNTVPPLYRETVADFFETLCNTWQMTTVPLPNRELRPGDNWPSRIPWLVSNGKRKESYAVELICTYEGMRNTGPGHSEARIHLSGLVKGPMKGGKRETLGKVRGHALFDVERGFHREVKLRISTEIDTGNSKARLLLTDERIVTREEGNTRGIKPATSNPGVTPPAGSGLPRFVLVGTAAVGQDFSVKLELLRPPPGTTITLSPPPGLTVMGNASQPIPPGPVNVPTSVVWAVRGMREGAFPFTAKLSSGPVIRWWPRKASEGRFPSCARGPNPGKKPYGATTGHSRIDPGPPARVESGQARRHVEDGRDGGVRQECPRRRSEGIVHRRERLLLPARWEEDQRTGQDRARPQHYPPVAQRDFGSRDTTGHLSLHHRGPPANLPEPGASQGLGQRAHGIHHQADSRRR